MKIDEMNLEEVEARLAEITSEIEQRSDVELSEENSFEQEITELQQRKAQLIEAEERKATAEAIERGEVKTEIVEERKEEIKMEEMKIYGVDSPEYRDAFFANLVGQATAEQRGIFADSNDGYGTGVALPVTTDTAIWDQVLTAHPILNDVALVKSGIVMKVSQMTPSNLGTEGGVKGKKDNADLVQLTFTTNEVALAGKDYTTYVTLSYAEAKMSVGAMEKFLVNEIANALGELLAADVFARILSDAASNEVTKGQNTYYASIKSALGSATQAINPVIYAPSALYYAILGEVDSNGQPIVRDGVVLGATLKKDNAATKITVVDPAMFVLNVVADTTITSQNMVSKGGYDIGGYMRAEGCLRKTNAGAFITVS